jgi:hypothetical protein
VNENAREVATSTRPHAGESVIDTRNWVGYALAAAGVVFIVLCLVAAGYGYEGWAWISGVTGPVVFLAGIAVVLHEHRRIRSEPTEPFARG